MWSISYLSEGEEDEIDDIIQIQKIPLIIESASDNDYKLKIPAFRILTNLVSGTTE